jgi:hypothetical protein
VQDADDDGRPLLLIWGNCQAEALRVMFDTVDGPSYRTVRVPPAHELVESDVPHVRSGRRAAGRAVPRRPQTRPGRPGPERASGTSTCPPRPSGRWPRDGLAELRRREQQGTDVAVSDLLPQHGAGAMHTLNHPSNPVLLDLRPAGRGCPE